ncbi:MAG: hypothetical protein M1828_007460 [Chrysothrix sp. TS-e1954]|nr:MAG: hypothetical protein M1828_007460 [Chrysothrix sp. TS-e1954]
MSDASSLKATVFVGGLDHGVNQQVLHDAFIPFGDINDISMPRPELPSSRDPHRGFGYVEFEQAEDAKEAKDNMNQSELYGRVIKVAAAKPQKDHNEGVGSKTAIWQQEGYLATHAPKDEEQKTEMQGDDEEQQPLDPMQGLEGLDVAGPKAK